MEVMLSNGKLVSGRNFIVTVSRIDDEVWYFVKCSYRDDSFRVEEGIIRCTDCVDEALDELDLLNNELEEEYRKGLSGKSYAEILQEDGET